MHDGDYLDAAMAVERAVNNVEKKRFTAATLSDTPAEWISDAIWSGYRLDFVEQWWSENGTAAVAEVQAHGGADSEAAEKILRAALYACIAIDWTQRSQVVDMAVRAARSLP